MYSGRTNGHSCRSRESPQAPQGHEALPDFHYTVRRSLKSPLPVNIDANFLREIVTKENRGGDKQDLLLEFIARKTLPSIYEKFRNAVDDQRRREWDPGALQEECLHILIFARALRKDAVSMSIPVISLCEDPSFFTSTSTEGTIANDHNGIACGCTVDVHDHDKKR